MFEVQRLITRYSCIGRQGVQLLLDGVVDYLPNPLEVPNYALDTAKDEEKVRGLCGRRQGEIRFYRRSRVS